jgi:hypothetical protein
MSNNRNMENFMLHKPICIPCERGEEHPWHDQGEFNEDYEIVNPPTQSSIRESFEKPKERSED